VTQASSQLPLDILVMLLAVGAFLLLAYRLTTPYPIVLVVGGAALGFVPGVPELHLEPDLVLVIMLPVLLYAAAFFSSLRDLYDNTRSIALLAVGLVVATTLGVAVVAHAVVDGMSWEAAFVLGAIVSPTDPTAATSIASRLGAPRRYVSIIGGESLVNDSTALIAYKFAVAAAVTGGFSAADAGGRFVLEAAAGVMIGLLVGKAIGWLRARIEDPVTEISISVLTPYIAYLPAEAVGVSAVLAAVTSGIYLGWRAPQLVSPATRMQAFAFWELLVFALNAVLFLLVGLSLPDVLDGISELSPLALIGDAAVVVATVIGLRFAWVFGGAALARGLGRRSDQSPAERTVIAWTGMRGAVSLAAALAIPQVIDAGGPFPQRDLVIFLAYAVICATLLVQGLTLPRVIDRLGLDDGENEAQRESSARLIAAQAAIDQIDRLRGEDWVRERSAERMRRAYEFRVRRFSARFDDDDDGELEAGSQAYQRLRREILEAERGAILRLRNEGRISDDIMHRIEHDLDLEDTRLEL
jgi:Na+/H+ antiporter